MGDLVVLVKASLNPEVVRARDGEVDLDATPLKISDIDRNAVEEASRLREVLGGKVYSITVLTWGPLASRERDLRLAVQEALSKGVDEAYVVADDSLLPGDQVMVANAIVSVIRERGLRPSLILAAEASIDETTQQVPGRVAAKLGYPYISYARRIEIKGDNVVVERDLEDYYEVVEAAMPAVVSVTQEINQPRPPTLIQIRRAARKPQHVLRGGDLGGITPPAREILGASVVSIARKGILIDEPDLEKAAEMLIEALEKEGVFKP